MNKRNMCESAYYPHHSRPLPRHQCLRTKNHLGKHICQCGVEWPNHKHSRKRKGRT